MVESEPPSTARSPSSKNSISSLQVSGKSKKPRKETPSSPRSNRGGPNRGQGRKAFDSDGNKVKTTKRYVTISEQDIERLTLYGSGNASYGVRILAPAVLKDKSEYVVVVSASGRGQNLPVYGPDGDRIKLIKTALHVDEDTYNRIMDLSGSGFSAGVRLLAAHLDRYGRLIQS